MDDMLHFSIAVSLGPDRARIFFCGELDLSSAAALQERVEETFGRNGADRRSLIILDLSDVTFCDATGLHALQELADSCRRLGTTLRLVNVSPKVHRIMELTDTLNQFNTEVDLRRGDYLADSSPRILEP